MRIILDSNIFVADFWLRGTSFRVLLDALPKTGHRLLVPKVVIEEVVAKYKQRLEETVVTLEKAATLLPGRTLALSADEVSVEIAKFREHLETSIKRIGMIVDYPDVGLEAVAARAVAKRRPFQKDDQGFRDVVIWETVLALCVDDEEPLVFVSNDAHAFANQGALHPQLQSDLAALPAPAAPLQYYTDLTTFLDDHIVPALDLLAGTRHEEFLDWLGTYANEHSFDMPIEYGEIYFDSDIDNWQFSMMENVDNVEIAEIRTLPSGEIWIRLDADASCEFDVYFYPPVAYSLPDEYHASTSGEGTTSKSMHFSAKVTLTSDWSAITSMEITEMAEHGEAE